MVNSAKASIGVPCIMTSCVIGVIPAQAAAEFSESPIVFTITYKQIALKPIIVELDSPPRYVDIAIELEYDIPPPVTNLLSICRNKTMYPNSVTVSN